MSVDQDFQAKIAEVAETEALRLEVQKRKLMLDDARTLSQVEALVQNRKELEIASKINFNALSSDAIELLQKTNTEYINSARNSMTFMNSEFKGIIPFFQKNLIFIGGRTGEGKSTTVANIAFSTISQKNPDTDKRRRVLVITNEEKTEDVYNRIGCLMQGWAYTNHDQFTDEQVAFFNKNIQMLNGLVTVIDNQHEGANGLTTSLEGICNIFDNLIRDQIHYDVVIIDYYQNVKYSKHNPAANEWEVQARLSAMLDIYKNVYSGPIVVMGQVEPPTENDTKPFQFRIKGRKVIMDVATCAVEMVADRDNYRTQWTIHKSRFNESVGRGFFTGFSRGKYVEYDTAFITEVARLKETRMMAKAGVPMMPTKEDMAAGAKMAALSGMTKK